MDGDFTFTFIFLISVRELGAASLQPVSEAETVRERECHLKCME